MPGKNNRANKEAILESYNRLSNMKAVCRELGYAYTTVVQVVHQSRGLCQCGNPIDNRSKRFCAKCLEMQCRAKARRRKKLVDAGTCLVCGGVRDHASSKLCEACRTYRLTIQRKYNMNHGDRVRTMRYSGLWGLMIERDNWNCQVCGQPAKELHHLDENHTHHAPDNLIALCRMCHVTLTQLNSHPNLNALLALVRPVV